MKKLKIRTQTQKKIYVHNDLSNAAFHFNKRVNERIQDDDRKGIAFDMMACLVLLAFTFESKINFLGNKLIPDWKEFQPFNKKISQVMGAIGVELSDDVRPYKSISDLKKFRDSIAHGKPVEIEMDEESMVEQDEIDREIDLSGEWEKYCTQEVVNRCFEDVDIIWKELLDKSGVKLSETVTTGHLGITLLEKIVDKET